jgi:hypothetical protein
MRVLWVATHEGAVGGCSLVGRNVLQRVYSMSHIESDLSRAVICQCWSLG